MPALQDEHLSRLHSAIRVWQEEIAAGQEALHESIGESLRLLQELVPMIRAEASPDILERVARAIDAWRAEVSDTQRALAAAVTEASQQVEALLRLLMPGTGAVYPDADAEMRRLREKLEASERTRREIETEYNAVLRALEEREAVLAHLDRSAEALNGEDGPARTRHFAPPAELAAFRRELEERERAVRATGEEAATLNARLAAMELELEPLRAQLEELAALRGQVADQREVIARREAALAEARADLERAINGEGGRDAQARDAEIAELRARLDAREAEVERLNLGAEQAAEALNTLYAQLDALRAGNPGAFPPAARVAELERQLETAREQAEAAVARAGALAGELETAGQARREPEGDEVLEQARARISELEAELDAAREREAQLLNDLAAARQLAEAFEERLARAAEEPAGSGTLHEDCDAEIATLRRDLAEARAEKDAEFAMAAEAHQRETNQLRRRTEAAEREAAELRAEMDAIKQAREATPPPDTAGGDA
jgi:exonuclease SbcC